MKFTKKKYGQYHNYFFFLLIVIISFLALSLHGQTIKDDVVKITAQYPDGSQDISFGFIFCEKNDTLFIITSSTVLISNYNELADSIFIEYHIKYNKSLATSYALDTEEGYLILTTDRPRDFQWNNSFCSSSYIEINNIVWIIGRDGNWNDATRKHTGQIVGINDNEILLDVPTKATGLLGSPIILNDCIAGLIVHDQVNQVTALDIEYFQNLLGRLSGYKVEKEMEKPYNLPYLIIGTGYGLPLFVTGMKYPNTSTYGFYLQTGLSSNLAIRLERNNIDILSHSYTVWDNTYQFRNHIKSYSFSLLGVVQPTSFEAANAYAFLKYSFLKHLPELRENDDSWKLLKDCDGFNQSYQDNYSSISIGFGVNGFLSKRILLGFECSGEYFFNSYVYVDPLEPFKKNKSGDILIYLKFTAGIVLGNPDPEIKILKPNRINPYSFN